MLIIWTPLSAADATRAYVDEPTLMVVTLVASSSLSKMLVPSLRPSNTADTAVGVAGFVISIIWTALSTLAVTRAYMD